jgi:hypothetical protein
MVSGCFPAEPWILYAGGFTNGMAWNIRFLIRVANGVFNLVAMASN